MTLGGWIILILSVGFASSLFIWCLYKLIYTPGETEHIHGFEIDVPDVNDYEKNND